MEFLVIFFLLLVIGFLFVPAALGTLVLFHIFLRKKTFPADSSNRINHMRLVWFALTREELFVTTFPWLRNDELDNLK